MKVGSLFAGIGGFDLAARWMGWETRWFSEIDPYASAVLQKHWPGVPNHGDITKIDFTTVEPVDLLCGGFPCQDVSWAKTWDTDGEYEEDGLEGKRSGLWTEYARAIGDLRPSITVMENVAALVVRGLDRILGDLADLGYDAEWCVVRASNFGAPHARPRLWLVAYPNRLRRLQAGLIFSQVTREAIRQASQWELRGAIRRTDGKTPLPATYGMDDGIPRGLDDKERITACGNTIVPQCAYVIFQAIQEAEERMRAA